MKTILITGSTGVVGSALIPYLLSELDNPLILLIRASDSLNLQARFNAMLEYWREDPGWRRENESRLTPIIGDITRPKLGMEQAVVATLLPDLCRIIHAAANVKMNLPLQAAREISVNSINAILTLANRAGQDVKIDYVSTMGVSGRIQGDIPETRLEMPRDYHNTYEAAKAEAEALVFEAMNHGRPATIYRPSMITGDSRTGRTIHFQIFHHLSFFFSGAVSKGWLPRLNDVQLDLVPPDYVAKAIARAGSHRESTGKVLHLSSGRGGGTDVNDLGVRLRAALARNGYPLPQLHRLPLPIFRTGLIATKHFLPVKARRKFALIPIALEYLNDNQCFVNKNSRTFLDKMNVRWPDTGDYIDNSLDYFAAYSTLGKKCESIGST